LRLDQVTDPAEFVGLMQQLKDESGCTYRQLEERATSRGEALPRSTTADILQRKTLPRPELVAAFVRACGAEEAEMNAWLAVWYRLAAEASSSPQLDPAAQASAEPAGPAATTAPLHPANDRSWRGRTAVPVAAVAVLAAVAAVVWFSDPEPSPHSPATARDGTAPSSSPSGSLGGWARIHPARTPGLCVTEGVDRTGRYGSAVAAQRPCGEAEPPKTTLEPVRDDLYHIKWDHPEYGVGCLTVIVGGPGDNLVEPWDDCRGSRATQLFRVEQVRPAVPGRYRLRPADGDFCLGMKDGAQVVGAEVVQEPCTGGADQEFLIELPLGT
jgi:hypothetical protein